MALPVYEPNTRDYWNKFVLRILLIYQKMRSSERYCRQQTSLLASPKSMTLIWWLTIASPENQTCHRRWSNCSLSKLLCSVMSSGSTADFRLSNHSPSLRLHLTVLPNFFYTIAASTLFSSKRVERLYLKATCIRYHSSLVSVNFLRLWQTLCSGQSVSFTSLRISKDTYVLY